MPTDHLRFAGKTHSLGVSESFGFAAELFEENAILFLEEFNDRLLVPIHPTGYGKQNEMQLSCHRRRKHSKLFAAQDSIPLRLIFLAVQVFVR
jgi:hypothetical protein